MQSERHLAEILGTAAVLTVIFSIGCAGNHVRTEKRLRLDLDRKDPRSFIDYYFGGLASKDGSDPFEAGLVGEVSGDYFLDTTALFSRMGTSGGLRDANGDGTLDWDELAPFLEATYYDRRGMPSSFDSLDGSTEPNRWFEISVNGVMTAATRRIRVPLEALRSALTEYKTSGDSLIYPPGTIIVADHILNGKTLEHTAMRKRAGGFWDFGVYDSAGARIPATTTPPKSLHVPTQCAGCHLGSRLYEPEKSFPGPARPGPEGPREVHWEGPVPSLELVRYFDEHRKRSDGILGIYGTLYVAKLLSKRAEGTLPNTDEHLLEILGL